MGLRGKQPQPLALRKLNGNPGGHPMLEQNAIPVALPSLQAPITLGPMAREVWARNAEELDRLGLLTLIDMEAFYRYCWTAERWHEAKMHVENEGPVLVKLKEDGKTPESVYQNPWWYIERSYSQELSKMETLFGMSPSARSRIPIRDRGASGADADPDGDDFA